MTSTIVFICGLDYASLFLTCDRIRNKTIIFLIHMLCHIIHLELPTDLFTEAFLNC